MCLSIPVNPAFIFNPSDISVKAKTYYKVYEIQNSWGTPHPKVTAAGVHLVSPFRGVKVVLKKNTEIKSNRASACITKAEIEAQTVSEGIHVFNTLEAARSSFSGYHYVIFEVKGTINEFIASGKAESVFRKVTVNRIVYYKGESVADLKTNRTAQRRIALFK